MSHTGEVRVPRSRRPSAAKRGGGGGDADSSVPRYGAAEQLTAVVRVSQRDADAGRVSEGELRNAFVHSYGIGGGGSGGREGEDADTVEPSSQHQERRFRKGKALAIKVSKEIYAIAVKERTSKKDRRLYASLFDNLMNKLKRGICLEKGQ